MKRLLLVLVACACDPGTAELEPTTESLHEHVFRPHCALPQCHAPPEPREGLDFSTVQSTLETAVNVAPRVGTAAESYPAIVVPGSPEESFLVAKVTHPGLDRGLPMPPTDEQLTDEAVAAIEEWIARMAP